MDKLKQTQMRMSSQKEDRKTNGDTNRTQHRHNLNWQGNFGHEGMKQTTRSKITNTHTYIHAHPRTNTHEHKHPKHSQPTPLQHTLLDGRAGIGRNRNSAPHGDRSRKVGLATRCATRSNAGAAHPLVREQHVHHVAVRHHVRKPTPVHTGTGGDETRRRSV